MDLDPVLVQSLEITKVLEGVADLDALLGDDLSLAPRDVRRLFDSIQDAGVCDLLDQIEDIVEAANELLDVLAVERSDERRFELVANLVAELVAAMFEVTELRRNPLPVGVALEEALECASGGEDVGTVLDEHVEEFLLARNERQSHVSRCEVRGAARRPRRWRTTGSAPAMKPRKRWVPPKAAWSCGRMVAS